MYRVALVRKCRTSSKHRVALVIIWKTSLGVHWRFRVQHWHCMMKLSIPFFFFFLSPRKLLGRFFYSTTGFVAAASASLTAILLERKSRYASCCRDNRVWSRNIGVLHFIKWKSIFSHFCISLIVADFGWNVGVSYIIHVQ